MPNPHSRLLAFPAHQVPAGGKLDSLRFRRDQQETELVMDYQEFLLSEPPILFERDGKPREQVHGFYHPRRLRFRDVQFIEGEALCTYFNDLPPDDPARTLVSALAWRTMYGENYYLFGLRAGVLPSLMLIARRCLAQARPGPTQEITLTRAWSPTPLSPARLVPDPIALRRRYGGDPIEVWLDGQLYKRRLFIGGVDLQTGQRPDVDAVLNVGETPSCWAALSPPCPQDRWDNKGEGSAGMSVSEIAVEARWVIERLQAGQRVLVHCTAGMNRSATVCCAVLILLEGLEAEAALVRVRQHHPWARPDTYHWLALRWLAHTLS